MGQRPSPLFCLALLGFGHALRRVVRDVHEEGMDLSFVEVDGRSWRNDFNEDYWIARARAHHEASRRRHSPRVRAPELPPSRPTGERRQGVHVAAERQQHDGREHWHALRR